MILTVTKKTNKNTCLIFKSKLKSWKIKLQCWKRYPFSEYSITANFERLKICKGLHMSLHMYFAYQISVTFLLLLWQRYAIITGLKVVYTFKLHSAWRILQDWSDYGLSLWILSIIFMKFCLIGVMPYYNIIFCKLFLKPLFPGLLDMLFITISKSFSINSLSQRFIWSLKRIEVWSLKQIKVLQKSSRFSSYS